MTPAGTVITSQATAVFGGQRYFSNEVQSVVTAVCYASLLPDGTVASPGQRTHVLPGGRAYLPFFMSNTGNGTFAYPIAVEVRGDGEWSPARTTVYLDDNRNGRVDANERPVDSVVLEQEESRHLVLEVVAPTLGSGSTLVSPRISCPTGRADANNVAELRLTDGPVLSVESGADPAQGAPGARLVLDSLLLNAGGAETGGPVQLVRMFDGGQLHGMDFVRGSAQASAGRLEFWDGVAWNSSEPATVQGVRVTLPNLLQDQQVSLRFEMEIAPAAAPGTRTLAVEAIGPGGPARGVSVVQVLPLREHHLGPRDNAIAFPGGEGSEFDSQEIPFLLVGRPNCLTLSLVNPGTGPDSYLLESVGLPPGMTGTFRTMVGTPLQQPIPLDVAEAIDFEFCIDVPPPAEGARTGQHTTQAGEDPDPGFRIRINAISTRSGARNETSISVGPLVAEPETEQELTARPSGHVESGEEVVYTLRITNASPASIEDLHLAFPIPDAVPPGTGGTEFLGATLGGRYDAARRRVSWRLPELAAGSSFTAEVEVAMPLMGPAVGIFAVPAQFSLTAAELGSGRLSNGLVHTLSPQALELTSSVEPAIAHVGDDVTVTLALVNRSDREMPVRLANVLPTGMEYRSGTGRVSVLDHGEEFEPEMPGGGTTPAPHPLAESPIDVARGALYDSGVAHRWDLTGSEQLRLRPSGEPGDSLLVSFEAVLTEAAANLSTHHAEAYGEIEVAGFELEVVSNRSTVVVEVSDDSRLSLVLSAEPGLYLNSEERILYTLQIVNTSASPLEGAEIVFPLPGFQPASDLRMKLLEVGQGGEFDAARGAVVWSEGTIQAGESLTRTALLSAPVDPGQGDTFALPARFSVTTDPFDVARYSNQLVHVFPAQALLIDAQVAPLSVRVGDPLTYTVTVTNHSKQAIRIGVATTIPSRTAYLPGTGRVSAFGYESGLEPRGAAPAEAIQPTGAPGRAAAGEAYGPGQVPIQATALAPDDAQEGELYWDFGGVDDLVLGPAGEPTDSIVLTYQVSVLPGATGALAHLAEATGAATIGGFEVALASNRASVLVTVADAVFAQARGLLTGRVYLDIDEDHAFREGIDTPLAGVRLLLANGWQTTTDSRGLYAFRELEAGNWALLLDRATAPFPPRERKNEAGNPYLRLVRVHSITVEDFPLQAPTVSATYSRRTRLDFGPVVIEKHLETVGDTTYVVLTVTSGEPLEDFNLSDPLPEGGTREFSYDLFEGTETIRYAVPAGATLTDPNVRWRDPLQ